MFTHEEFREKLLKRGEFDHKALATILGCSESMISKWLVEPIEGEVYHKVYKNTIGIYNFAIKHNIDLDNLPYEELTLYETPKAEPIKVGDMTTKGQIIAINKVGNSMVYVVISNDNQVFTFSTKEIAELVIR